MARHLVALRLALLRGNVRAAGPWMGVGLLASLLIGALLGSVAGLGVAAARTQSDLLAANAIYGGSAFVFLIWLLGPLLTTGGGAGLDAARLAHFPIPPRQLLTGLAAAACVGAGGVATVLFMFGAATAAAVNPLARLVALPAIVLQLAICVVSSQLVQTALSSLMKSRRWRDLALFAAPAIGIALQIAGRAAGSSAGEGQGFVMARGLRTIGRVLPSGWAARALVDARLDRPLSALAGLVGGVVLLAMLLGIWSLVLQRAVTSTAYSGGPQRSPGVATRRSSLYPALVAWWPRRRWSVVAAKELRLLWRDPRQRVQLVSALFYGMFPVVSAALSSRQPGTQLGGSARGVLVAALPAFMVGASSTNLFGYDGRAHWTNVAAGEDLRSDLLGKQAARLVVAVVASGVVAWVLGARSAAWDVAAAAWVFGIAVFAFAVGLASVVSVRVPVPIPDRQTNVFATGDAGRGLAALGPSLGVFLGAGIVFGPLAVLFVSAVNDAAGVDVRTFAVVASATAAGAAGWRVATDTAVRRSADRQPEFLEALTRR